jgi:hypothetical protein
MIKFQLKIINDAYILWTNDMYYQELFQREKI